MNDDDKGLRGKMARQGEEAIGKVAQELLENPMVSRALAATFEARERATRAQELAMSALNLPSAGDLERLTRRLRSVSQRLETIEDGLDRLESRIDQLGSTSAIDRRLAAIEELLARLEAAITSQAAAPTAVSSRSRRAGERRKAGAAQWWAQVGSGLRLASWPERAERRLAHPLLGRAQVVLADPGPGRKHEVGDDQQGGRLEAQLAASANSVAPSISMASAPAACH